MKLVKSLALGSAAALVALSGAHAADLPGAEPVEYVKVCDAYGAGFFYIPGSDTCLQIGGFARLEVTSGELIRNAAGDPKEDSNNRTGYRARARLWFDARTESDYGTIRTFIRLQIQRETGAVAQTAKISNGLTGLDADDSLFDQAYVQFAGLTAGIADSFWDFKPYPTFTNPFISDRTVPTLAYTVPFGDVSASIAIEDKTARYRTGTVTGTTANGTNGQPYAGQSVPDIVANVRIKQGWGEAQLSGVAHQINTRDGYGATRLGVAEVGGDNAWGWGLQAGFKINLPALAKGDYLWGSAAYTDGAGLSYNGLGDSNNGSGTTQNVANLNPQFDFLIVGGDIEKTKAFNANLGLLHYWTPQWRSAVQASYIKVDYRKVDADWSTVNFAGNVIWSPVKKLDIGGEVVYARNLNRANVGYGGGNDKDAIVGRLRVQRDF